MVNDDRSIPSGATDDPAPSAGPTRRERRAAPNPLLVGALVLAGLALTLVAAQWGYHHAPSGLLGDDFSLIELRTIEAWRHPLLVGPYSRLGFHHPGPLLYYVLAPVYRLAGGGIIGLLAGSALVQICAFALTLFVAFRVGGLRAMTLLAVLLAALLASFWPWFADPWNPYLATTSFLLVVVASWAIAERDLIWIPVAAAAGSFSVQSHVSFAGPAVAALVTGVVVAAVRSARHRKSDPDAFRRLLGWTAVGAVVTLLLWLPPLLQILVRDQTFNLHKVLTVVSGGAKAPGPVTAARALLHGLRVDAPWLTGSRGSAQLPTGIGVPIFPLVFVATGVYAWWSKRRTQSLFLILVISLAAAWVSLARLRPPYYDYLYLWLPALALLAWFAVLATAWDVATDDAADRRLRSGARLLAALVGLALTVEVLHVQVDALGIGAVLLGVAVVAATALIAFRRGPAVGVARRTAIAVGTSVVLLLGCSSVARAWDAGPNPNVAHTQSQRQRLALASKLADAVPAGSGTVDLVFGHDGVGLAEVAAVAVARRGIDVVVPRSAQIPFGPELVGDPDPRRPQIHIVPEGDPAPEGGRRIGSWNGVDAYVVPGR